MCVCVYNLPWTGEHHITEEGLHGSAGPPPTTGGVKFILAGTGHCICPGPVHNCYLFNHNYAVANMYVHTKFDRYVQFNFWGTWPPK